MKKNVLFLFGFLISFCSDSQTSALQWAKQFGGSTSSTWGNSLSLDAANNVYTIGSFSWTADFDPGPSVFNIVSGSFSDQLYISKLDASGNFLWAKSIGPSNCSGITILNDPTGNIYICGNFMGTCDFNPGSGTFNMTASGSNYDFFLLKLDTNGNFIWAKRFGSIDMDLVSGMAMDSFGNLILTGAFSLTVDFDPGAATYNHTSAGYFDMFVLKMDPAGNFVWAKSMGGSAGYEQGNAIDVDNLGNIYLTAWYTGTVDFDPGFGTCNLTASGTNAACILEMDGGGSFVWAKSIGGPTNITSECIKVDLLGNVYTSGNFKDSIDLDPGTATHIVVATGNYDIFISKLDHLGNYIWGKSIKGNQTAGTTSLLTDSLSSIFVSGNFQGIIDLDPGSSTFDLVSYGNTDMYISKLDTAGNFIWATNFGDTLNDGCISLKMDTSSNLYFTGSFDESIDFDPGPGTASLSSLGTTDACVVKLSQGPVGLLEKTYNVKITVFPNPSEGIFNILVSKQNTLTMQVYNILGEVVSKTEGKGSFQVNLTAQQTGLYFLELISEGNVISTQKIVKQ